MWLTYFEQYLNGFYPRLLEDKPWNYKDDLCVIGAYKLYKATGDEKWLAPILASAPYLMDADGTIVNSISTISTRCPSASRCASCAT